MLAIKIIITITLLIFYVYLLKHPVFYKKNEGFIDIIKFSFWTIVQGLILGAVITCVWIL